MIRLTTLPKFNKNENRIKRVNFVKNFFDISLVAAVEIEGKWSEGDLQDVEICHFCENKISKFKLFVEDLETKTEGTAYVCTECPLG